MRIVQFFQCTRGFSHAISYLELANEGLGERLDVNFTQQYIRKHFVELFGVHTGKENELVKLVCIGICG